MLEPFYIALRWLLRPLIIFSYTQYLKLVARLKRSAFMQNKILFIFGNRYFIHVMVVLLSFFVASTNILQAQEIKSADVFAQDSALYQIVNPGDGMERDITESGLIPPDSTGSYISNSGLMVATIPNLDPEAASPRNVGDQLSLLDNGSALVGTNTAETSVGVRAGIIEYKVKDGDTIGEISDRFGISVSTLLWANSLTSSSYIRPGNTLKIPPASGVIYTVKDGDTLDKIIATYKGNLDETIKVNDIGTDHLVAVGTQLIVVDGTPPPPPPPPASSYIASRYSDNSGPSYQSSDLPNYVTAGQFNWPVGCHGAMTTYWGHPNRARDFPCPIGTPIYASTEGTVRINSTGQWGGGYGNSLDIYGPNGIKTRYAHMSAFAVSGGQYVSRGQVIGYVGMTGRTTGPHLHFEININGVNYDPISFF
ncbi:MAG: M23 family metallopeptidase [Patescibacteria group bacterium]